MSSTPRKDSFVLYTSHYEVIKKLPLEDKGRLLDAIYQYAMNGETDELPIAVDIAFGFIRQALDKNNEKYQAIVERNRRNGQGGGAPKGNRNAKKTTQNNPKQPTGLFGDDTDSTTTENGGSDSSDGDQQSLHQHEKGDGFSVEEGVETTQNNPKQPKTTLYDNEYDNDNGLSDDNQQEANASMSPGDAAPSKTLEDIDFRDLLQFFNKSMKNAQIPKIQSITAKRKAAVTARAKEHGKQAVMTVIKKAAESSFLNGGGERSWVADFDWLFRPNNFPKVLEGNYDNRQHSVIDGQQLAVSIMGGTGGHGGVTDAYNRAYAAAIGRKMGEEDASKFAAAKRQAECANLVSRLLDENDKGEADNDEEIRKIWKDAVPAQDRRRSFEVTARCAEDYEGMF